MTRSIARAFALLPVMALLGCTSSTAESRERTQSQDAKTSQTKPAPLAQEPTQNVNPTAAALQDFNTRVKAYVDLRDKSSAEAPPLKQTKDPGDISAAQKALALNIRAARAGAKQGDIFTPEIAKLFRSLLIPETTGADGAETKAVMKEDPPLKVPLAVNADYPDEEPLSTVPPNILQSLPKLPEGMEYRFVRRNMILRDARANVIVDFMTGAIR
jgi:hypothetical protein